ncbi:MAG: NPCBM/NEW2 domain-containing protein, partial [Candidatus Solibacter sp.]|nr:NPCBM/NEW2 domain-containing protein [Candidatus Solibacter sp.]
MRDVDSRAAGERRIHLAVSDALIRLETGEVSYRFTRANGTWAFDSVWVRGKKTAVPLSRAESFYLGGGEAREFTVVSDSAQRKEVRFSGAGAGQVSFRVLADDRLPAIAVELSGVEAPACAWRTAIAAAEQQGAWATRGETASDAEGREVFIDGSGRLVFGHSRAGVLDTAYVIQAEVLDNINRRGKTMQPSDTFFKSGRKETAGGFFGYWQIKMGAQQPKRFAIVFDRDLGGRMHDVCEKYYADAVDSQVDLAAIESDYDPYLALERMPLRLSCPESLIPGYGWHMEEYFPGYAKAAYPFGEDSGIQTAALLAYEGHATRRDWEKYFGEHVLSQMPLWGEADGKGFFVRRPGGWTRWAYNTDYQTPFPLMEGGNWTNSEHLYQMAVMFQDAGLKQRAMDLMRHDVLVKLDLENMFFPPCWNPLTGKLQDHRDDWEITPGLAYCAEISSEVLYAETRDAQFLKIADRITDWLASILGPETRMNHLHPKVNTYHCFSGPIVRSLVHRFERGGGQRFLEIAQDIAWVMILTLGTTPHKDPAGRSFTGVTCVGVRGCVDYDCAPNLLKHVGGPGYAKFLAMQQLVLPRDSWKDAFRVQEQRDLNLRTNYDNYARGMANLTFALNMGSDPRVAVYERLAPRRDRGIRSRRDMILANGTMTDRRTSVQARFLEAGRYKLELDGRALGARTAAELEKGIEVAVPRNSTRRLKVTAVSAQPAATPARQYDNSSTYLSDLADSGAQRGIGLPVPVYRKDRSFRGNPITFGGRTFEKGLGLAANTAIVYNLDGRYRTFAATFGVDADAAGEGPKPSVYLTVLVDGRAKFTSGGVFKNT